MTTILIPDTMKLYTQKETHMPRIEWTEYTVELFDNWLRSNNYGQVVGNVYGSTMNGQLLFDMQANGDVTSLTCQELIAQFEKEYANANR